MDRLTPCDSKASLSLVGTIGDTNSKRGPDYVAKTFPSIVLDITRLMTESATENARDSGDPKEAIRLQLKPYFAFGLLLGKCPQITGLMYNYFKNSSFQPFPENLFTVDEKNNTVHYAWPGFSDDIVKEILITYIKFLSYDTQQFSSIWNWSELGRLVTIHPTPDVRFLALACLSIIFKPTRAQHRAILMQTCHNDYQTMIDLQIKYRNIYENTFKLGVDPEANQRSIEFAHSIGFSNSGYSFCSESFSKLSNVLLPKRDISAESQSNKARYDQAMKEFVIVNSLIETISKVAYAISISRPCIVKGPIGSGKTALLDYIAASTNRVEPPDYIKVQICDQIDSRVLVGSYISTEVPGQFEWQPGSLTKAMIDGSWILFEDIGTASPDVIQVLNSVIENGNLSCISTCPIQLTRPHPDFRILFTLQTNSKANASLKFIEKPCDIVQLIKLSDSELESIIEKKFNLQGIAPTILKLYNLVSEELREESSRKFTRQINYTDLFKLCRRLRLHKISLKDGMIDSYSKEYIILDTMNCFLAHLSRKELFRIAIKVGDLLNCPVNEVQKMLTLREPKLDFQESLVTIGTASLQVILSSAAKLRSTIAYTNNSLRLMECIGNCINLRESVLLVGETGVGKTSLVQHMADLLGTRLISVNLSQQSDSSDLLGGFKPVEMKEIIRPLHNTFEELFQKTYDPQSNQRFLDEINNHLLASKTLSQWSSYLKILCNLSSRALAGKLRTKELYNQWNSFYRRARNLARRICSQDEAFSISLAFSDGTLLRAVKEGHWILLDEVNLAEPDVLQCLIFILDSIRKSSRLHLQTPTNSSEPIKIHPSFRVFACMNPSTDIGKRELDPSIRSRFTEYFIDDITNKSELRLIVESYVKACMTPVQIEKLVTFYLELRARTSTLSDNSGHSPVYSLRTLCRSLAMCSTSIGVPLEKCLYESLKVTFLHQLDESSQIQVEKLIEQTLFEKQTLQSLKGSVIPMPKDGHQYISVEGFWVQQSNERPIIDPKYIMTDSVHKNLCSLARIIFMSQRKLPVLIQGNTSVGKTSLVMYLAKLTGNKCYRINNHEHTDLQEYVGRYVLRETGEIGFQEGLLVKAMKKGYWIILDELNLAPSELLEALNRVLDDNRELYIPETRELIKAHSKFMLFATQNPPGEYAGRKFLSRAFRNRFSELHFADIPTNELETILQERCEMPAQYGRKIVSVMRELQMLRRESGCFNGKQGFMTMRDLLRWGQRYAQFKFTSKEQFYDWENHIAIEGLILLEGRVRTREEADIVKTVIEKVFKRQLDRDKIYNISDLKVDQLPKQFKHIYFSHEFKRMYIQLSRALKYEEPVLLCGQTGCGKTTACQLYAEFMKQQLLIYNCHMGTESSDFIGSVRPIRDSGPEEKQQLFPWVDGPLVQAMKRGSIFLMDEISLADDAVLERINSVMESPRTITLAEKAGEEIYANEEFRLVATMNPGGDYGKKELSPALRNRFTEIYCHNTIDVNQILSVINSSLDDIIKTRTNLLKKILSTMERFLSNYYEHQDLISIRDILSWCSFLNKTTNSQQPRPLSIQEAIVNGASLVFFDQIGTCGHKSTFKDQTDLLNVRLVEIKKSLNNIVETTFGKDPKFIADKQICDISCKFVKFKKFLLPKGYNDINKKHCEEFVSKSSTVKKNLIKIARAMQLDRPILLEGDPGVGKTSIVTALAKLTGHDVVRINLSEQTDLSDLFGSDLPDTKGSDSDSPRFTWCDGPLLKAIKNNQWILLDEMNLASQSVLEGLNSCLDHRGEIFIPELNRKFEVDRSGSRIFACQNPYSQGGARKGLPQSFLNRFTSIYMKAHTTEDLNTIIENLYPKMPKSIIANLITFNNYVNSLTAKSSGQEFNLRNVIYWSDLMTKNMNANVPECLYKPEKFVQFAYLDGIRSMTLKTDIIEKFEDIFGIPVYEPPYREIRLGESSINLGRTILKRKYRLPPHLANICVLKYQLPYMESLGKAIEYNKMPILVGQSGLGKKSMIKILAGLSGNILNVMSANREMDTLELIGSYEQRNFQRQIMDIITKSKDIVLELINSVDKRDRSWIQIFNHVWLSFYASFPLDSSELSCDDLINNLQVQLMPVKELLTTLEPLTNPEQELIVKSLIKQIDQALDKIAIQRDGATLSGNFDWIDSILLKSVKEGSWLLIEDANLMNPATLDRLNSLVEPDGYLSLNEKGAVSSSKNKSEILKPHPDFRLIITMDPENGELSRAMRNRGVEIFVQAGFFFEDFLMLIDQNGFAPEESKTCMLYTIMQTCYDVHKKITGEKPEEDGCLLTYFGLNYITNLTHHVRRGANINDILGYLLAGYYSKNGFAEVVDVTEIMQFVREKMDIHGKSYQVKLADERYKWMNFRHDLMSLTGGDADVAMVDRDTKIFYDDFNLDNILKLGEYIDFIDVVNTCTAVKISFELSTRGDFDYRRGFIVLTFSSYQEIMHIIAKQINYLSTECLPVLAAVMTKCPKVPINEVPIDSRNFPDIHHILQCLDSDGSKKSVELQNRWLLSLQRVTLNMIVEFIELKSMVDDKTSLYKQSERLKNGEIAREHLIRPTAEIASDLYDLLNGILRFISNRCFDDKSIAKVMAKSFWISYLICKLKRGYAHADLVAVSNQLPMLWALTYQKVIDPIVKTWNIANQTYKNRKFSNRIEQVTHFLDVSLEKPSLQEKNHYKKVVNKQATSFKICEKILREVDRMFAKIVTKSDHDTPLEHRLDELIVYSGMLWSSSDTLTTLYYVEDNLVRVGLEIKNLPDPQYMSVECKHFHTCAIQAIQQQTSNFNNQEADLMIDLQTQLVNRNRHINALDHFAPIWQFKLLAQELRKKVCSKQVCDLKIYLNFIKNFIKKVQGIVLSPRFYGSLLTYLYQQIAVSEELPSEGQSRIDLDMFVGYLYNLLLENVVFDHQLVTWTKLRVTTSSLQTIAPLLPEFSPIISLTASYSLDMSHLKLNSYLDSDSQLKTLLVYLVKSYAQHKVVKEIESNNNILDLANKFHQLRNQADGQTITSPQSLNDYLKSNGHLAINSLITMTEKHFNLSQLGDALRLIQFGYLTSIDYAPIFTIDPALKTREKLEVYRAELAHIKLDLNYKNTLFYWRTGENLQLNEIDSDDAIDYPFATKILIDRKSKLEKSIAKLRRELYNRPKSDDGSLYFELREKIQNDSKRLTKQYNTLMREFTVLIKQQNNVDDNQEKISNFICLIRTMIKNLEKIQSRLRAEYTLYSDILAYYLTGIGFIVQGLRNLFFHLDRHFKIRQMVVKNASFDKILNLFSFNNYSSNYLDSVRNKINSFSQLPLIYDPSELNKIQSHLLRSILLELRQHIIMSPSDIIRCIPVMNRIVTLYHNAWLARKQYIEEEAEKKAKLYEYKTHRTIIGTEISVEKQEFFELCSRFPTYEYVFREFILDGATSSSEQNLETEQKVINLNKSADLSNCNDICKAYYKLMMQASQSLLCHDELVGLNSSYHHASTNNIPMNDSPHVENTLTCEHVLDNTIRQETDIMFSLIRNCIGILDHKFDAKGLEYFIMQANYMLRILNENKPEELPQGTLTGSIDILEENVFNIYHDGNPSEALKLQKFMQKVDQKIYHLRKTRNFESHTVLNSIIKLIVKINKFLITDPMMKFITGTHALLDKLDEWNHLITQPAEKMSDEMEELLGIIKCWRGIELKSWTSSLHWVKRNYIDKTLCDLWFQLHGAFQDPIKCATTIIRQKAGSNEFDISLDTQEYIYLGFALYIKNFFEEATLGDHRLRLDLVYACIIQIRFQALVQQGAMTPTMTKQSSKPICPSTSTELVVDSEKLTIYVYNTYKQYKSLFESVDLQLKSHESEFMDKLTDEIRIVSWQNRKILEVKNAFRISHRKLNSIMSKYLQILQKPIPNLGMSNNKTNSSQLDQDARTVNIRKPEAGEENLGSIESQSEALNITLNSINFLIQATSSLTANDTIPVSGGDSIDMEVEDKLLLKLKQLNDSLFKKLTSKYVENLNTLELVKNSTSQDISNYYQHRVQDVIINNRDSQEEKAGKQKLCRQMYHSKKFALQSIFKSLKSLGLSFQRGLNLEEQLDVMILSLEPARGLIHKRSKCILTDASKLIDNNDILFCNHKYQELVAYNMSLLAQSRHEDLTADQMSRIRGYSLDLVMSLIRHSKGPAKIYRHLLDIQGATNCLKKLNQDTKQDQKTKESHLRIFNYSEVYSTIKCFDKYLNRAWNCLLKLKKLSGCCVTSIKETSDYESLDSALDQYEAQDEKMSLMLLIKDIPECDSLMTTQQLDHFSNKIDQTFFSLQNINDKLKDILLARKDDYVYTTLDVNNLQAMYDSFFATINGIVYRSEDEQKNLSPATALGSILTLMEQVELELGSKLKNLKELASQTYATAIDSPTKTLDKRVAKLVKMIKLANQQLHKVELSDHNNEARFGERSVDLKPFEVINSSLLDKSLKLEEIHKKLANVILTINCQDTNIHSVGEIVHRLSPIMGVYLQTVAAYLNIMYSSLKVKLTTADNVIRFLIDLTTNGFGLPYKVDDNQETRTETRGQMSEDNAGFGEGGTGETDASKKIEFESQLDELQDSNNKPEDNEQIKEDQVEAHDDGIEMTDDIGGEAQGPDQQDAGISDQEEDDDADQADDFSHLDKEMGQVDDDENQLDEKLWSDQEDAGNESDDDERDLKDFLNENDVDQPELEAKNDQLPVNKRKQDNEKEENGVNQQSQKEQKNGEDEEQSGTQDENEKDSHESDAQMDEVQMDQDPEETQDEGGEKGVDMQDETNQLTTDSQDNMEADNDNFDADDEDNMDVVSLEDISDNSLLPESRSPDPGQITDNEAEAMQEDRLSEGECPSSSQENLNDDIIDRELEKPIEFPVSGNPLVDPLKQLFQDRANDGQSASARHHEKSADDLITGSYSVFDESPDDPLDDGDGLEESCTKENPSKQAPPPPTQENKISGEDDDKNPDYNHNSSDDIMDVTEVKKPSVDLSKENSNEDKRPNKRTPTLPSDDSEIERKRQRIEDAKDKDDKERDTPKDVSSFRHLSTASKSELEVIDLASSDDEDFALAPEEPPMDTEQTSSLKPKEFSSTRVVSDLCEPIDFHKLWSDCLTNCNHLVHELCQQLQIVLQPTKMSKYKGDYKSGKRLNMRKIIAYVASNYRKDKIWLRRTKPSKRTYSICLAVDNSSSMSENNCRQMTYESLALLAKSLSIIEAGSLNVISFGEKVNSIHEFDDPYHDSLGSKWLQELQFNEKKTSYSQLLEHGCRVLSERAQTCQSGSLLSSVNQLLIIISDGRNITNEEQEVKAYLRQLKSMRVVTFFVVIDDMKRNGGKSIVDVKKPIGFGPNMTMVNYMELFPFPFYVLLRKLEAMPSIIGDVLRQWFEIVTQES